MAEHEHKLTPSEKQRNVHGPMYQYEFCEQDQGPLAKGHGLSKIQHNMCKELAIYRDEVSYIYF